MVVFEQKGFSINFLEDCLKGTELAHQIKKYGFFSYSTNEALRLSPKEEKQIEAIVESIDIEYQNYRHTMATAITTFCHPSQSMAGFGYRNNDLRIIQHIPADSALEITLLTTSQILNPKADIYYILYYL